MSGIDNHNEGKGKKPDYEIRVGRVRGCVWASVKTSKENRKYPEFSIKIEKTYKDGDEWKKTDYFFADELNCLRLVADYCERFCIDSFNAFDPNV